MAARMNSSNTGVNAENQKEVKETKYGQCTSEEEVANFSTELCSILLSKTPSLYLTMKNFVLYGECQTRSHGEFTA
jgi:hypothetical protein